MDFFAKSYSEEEILRKLKEYASEDAEPHSGRLFSIAFETGLDGLREIAHRALTTFADKNILDFLEFPSTIKLEKDIVDVARKN
jgi:glutamate/tyrosine decarboxylase-like PLP-dependent enzyme